MKRIRIYHMLAVLFTACLLYVSCTKETADTRLSSEVATTQVTLIKSDSATITGFVVAGTGYTEKGVCWDTVTAPTIAKNKKITSSTDISKATYTVTLSGLQFAKKYYVRAYAINEGTAIYGTELNFTTLPVIPKVVTGHFTATTGVSATGGGNITNDGGAPITARGVCYGIVAKPTISDNHTTDGTGSGVFTSSLTKLTGQTTYHVRAYAKNSAGIAYGADSTFTTPISILTWYLPGDYVAASYGGSYADWSPGPNSPYIMSTLAKGNLLEGYVYMANTTNNWKFATQPNWNGPNYANNDANGTIEPGKLDPNAKDNIASPMGYYKINADATALTYTAVATTWGIIGNATPGGWNTDTPMAYYPTSQVWGVGATLSQQSPPNDGMKFRANSNWNLNYGDTGADGVLDAGGDNIGVSTAGDYAVTLNLSQPNHYTYSLNRWGIIGDFNGWAASVPLTWDATNKVFTVTVALTNGGFKFRANDNWNVNLGGKGTGDTTPDNYTDAVTVPLSSGGKNIGAPGGVAATCKITLDPWTLKATVTPVAKKK